VRNVIVTGGSRGIGLGIVEALAARGYRAIAVARGQNAELERAIAAAGQGGGAICFKACDLSDTGLLSTLVKDIHAEFGALYGLVNNAGLGSSGVLATMPDGTIDRLVRLNVVSPMLLTKYVVRAMMVSGGSRIVNISSIVASTGYNGLAPYGATKAAMIGFTHSLARELGPLGITVNAVAPGFVDTDMTRELNAGQRAQIERRAALKRLPAVTDIAAAVTFLLSDGATNITGTVLTVDAGNTA
jgi:3-oxoacyl-[acyl-carrier protein] reductase